MSHWELKSPRHSCNMLDVVGLTTHSNTAQSWMLQMYVRSVFMGPGYGHFEARPFQILLGNLLATFRILSNLFVREQLVATFRKTSTFLVTFGLF